MVAFQWHVLRGAIQALRDDEEGMGTLEVLVIAAGLVALATSAIYIIKNQAQAKTSTLETPPSTYIT
jgi:hypothetical protein